MRYAVVDGNGNIINVILWDGANDYRPRAGTVLVPDDGTADIGGRFIDGVFIPAPEPPVDYLAEALEQREVLLHRVADKTRLWGLQLQLGIITPESADRLQLWLDYAQMLEAIDISQAPDIDWPPAPE
ncbi:tail fiber assembly protein [Enterobacter kobei]|nr:tail fiber assembly protein [Enterobacter kobei]